MYLIGMITVALVLYNYKELHKTLVYRYCC
uniref:Uncharacterized protein n=1 Tax=Anguilla anguilla TaxID=7936 RepID=A0A0E9V6L5_ANGAN